MILETDKYYLPKKNRVIVLPIGWREEFHFDTEEKILIGINKNEILICTDLATEVEDLTLVKINKKGAITIPKALDEKLEPKLHQLLVENNNECFILSPV